MVWVVVSALSRWRLLLKRDPALCSGGDKDGHPRSNPSAQDGRNRRCFSGEDGLVSANQS